MANSRIRFLRANASNLDSDKKLKAGQPLYIADKNYLVIGNLTDDNKASNAQPIDARRIHGYTSDNNTLNNTNTGEYKVEPYITGDSKSGLLIKAPDEIKFEAGKVSATEFTGNLKGNASTVTNGIYSVKLQTNLSCDSVNPINTPDTLKGGDMLQITCSVVADGSTYYSTGLIKLPDTISDGQIYKCVYTFSVSTVDTSTTPNTLTYYNYTLPVEIRHVDVSGSYVKYYPIEVVQTEYAGSSVTTNLYTSSYTLVDVYKLYK